METAEPGKKRQKTPDGYSHDVTCDSSVLFAECKEDIGFLKTFLERNKLWDDPCAQYAAIRVFIRLGENLTFLRDDKNFYKEEHQLFKEYKLSSDSPSFDLIRKFILFRNQLLHQNIYLSSTEQQQDLGKIFSEAKQKIVDLEELIGESSKDSPETLSKPLETFNQEKDKDVNIFIQMLQKEIKILDQIKAGNDGNPKVKNLALEACYLRCCQILSDLQKKINKEQDLQNVFKEFGDLFIHAKTIRVCLAHPASFDETKKSECNQLLETLSDALSNFCVAVTQKLKEKQKKTSSLDTRLASTKKVLSKLTELPVDSKAKPPLTFTSHPPSSTSPLPPPLPSLVDPTYDDEHTPVDEKAKEEHTTNKPNN